MTQYWRAAVLLVVFGALTWPHGVQAQSNPDQPQTHHKAHRGRGHLPAGRHGHRRLGRRVREHAARVRASSPQTLEEQRVMSRNARHRMSRVMLKERWGETLRLTEAQDELRVHGRRMARLHRILVLSKEEKKDTVEERVKVAIEKEQQRYQHHMEELRSTVGAKGADSPGAPAQAGAPTPTPGAAGSAP